MNSTVFLVSDQMRCSSRFIFSRVIASSAPNGSSISSTAGSWTSARQIDARCCMPPESCHGYLFSKPSRPTISSSACAFGEIAAPVGSLRISICSMTLSSTRAPGEQHRALEHDADVRRAGRRPRLPPSAIAPGGSRQQTGDHLQQRRLAAARRADDRQELAGADVEGRAACSDSTGPSAVR